jgi:hypothetical protein
MTVLLDNAIPHFNDIALLGSNPLRVYTILFESAQHDVRENCGGTSSWSIKGLAAELKIKRETVSRALNKILDSGHIQIAGEITNKDGSNNTLWRVTHPNMLDAVRYSIEIMGKLPSERLKAMRTKAKRVSIPIYTCPIVGHPQEIYSYH